MHTPRTDSAAVAQAVGQLFVLRVSSFVSSTRPSVHALRTRALVRLLPLAEALPLGREAPTANLHRERRSWAAADMRPRRNSRPPLAASSNRRQWRGPGTPPGRSRRPPPIGNPQIAKGSSQTSCGARLPPERPDLLVARAGKEVQFSPVPRTRSSHMSCSKCSCELQKRHWNHRVASIPWTGQ